MEQAAVQTNNETRKKINVDVKAEAKGEKKEKQAKAPKEPMTPQRWFNSYVGKDKGCAAKLTLKLAKGMTIDQAVNFCKEYHAEQKHADTWGNSKGQITSHLRWLRTKGMVVTEAEGGVFKVTAPEA